MGDWIIIHPRAAGRLKDRLKCINPNCRKQLKANERVFRIKGRHGRTKYYCERCADSSLQPLSGFGKNCIRFKSIQVIPDCNKNPNKIELICLICKDYSKCILEK